MIERELLSKGDEAILYRCNDGTVLKVFYRDDSSSADFLSGELPRYQKLARREFENLFRAFELGLSVPMPVGLEKVVLTPEDLKNIGQLSFKVNEFYRQDVNPNDLIGHERYAVRRRFVPGKSLYNRIWPSLKLRRKLRALNERIDQAGLELNDRMSGNYVVTPQGNIYVVNCLNLVPKRGKGSEWLNRRVSTCRVSEMFGDFVDSMKCVGFL